MSEFESRFDELEQKIGKVKHDESDLREYLERTLLPHFNQLISNLQEEIQKLKQTVEQLERKINLGSSPQKITKEDILVEILRQFTDQDFSSAISANKFRYLVEAVTSNKINHKYVARMMTELGYVNHQIDGKQQYSGLKFKNCVEEFPNELSSMKEFLNKHPELYIDKDKIPGSIQTSEGTERIFSTEPSSNSIKCE